MANIFPNIKPNGINQKDEVDLLYMIVSSLEGICAKLDLDSGVPSDTYEANCSDLITTKITDKADNIAGTPTGARDEMAISVQGMSDKAWVECMYQIYNCIETLCEQLDRDSLTQTDFEANCYTAKILHMITNGKGNTLGNGNTFWFKPAGPRELKQVVDNYYNILDALETLTEQLDGDGTVNNTNYEALWFTATILLRVQDSKGNGIGVSR